MKSIQDTFTLSNGVKIPCVGFGTWNLENSQSGIDIIKTAIDCGYRHIDTAAAYHNENAVGRAVTTSGLPREEMFVTSKLDNASHGYEETLAAFDRTMNELGLDYLDLYLIHWPKPYAIRDRWKILNEGTWLAFEELYEKGLIKAIGVSNFLEHHLEPIFDKCNVMPMVNQIEIHPQYPQYDIVSFCKSNGILVEAWSPLIGGRAFKNAILIEMAKKYGKTVSQICLRWSIQMGALPLPKSSTAERMRENADIFDFEISAEDINVLRQLEELGSVGSHPDTAEF
ncbi:MAG: aldo/keto reductase [Clostridiales bacterium]|nr:aldo/keto reductase [Clostridiales bacterium]